jgi:hypothetical protein
VRVLEIRFPDHDLALAWLYTTGPSLATEPRRGRAR